MSPASRRRGKRCTWQSMSTARLGELEEARVDDGHQTVE
jgi:hypothetical protein